ncbi:hypothetical protein CEUSTIGMA_g2961.t1 [Chlamydomonas eustigma]|uniref:Xanthine/uracil/vitamin C permease n=1 Tax=Chlamydomonas eustigma TaxID=1157962 RepID=A0A250WXF0_9CHLO|nr:hypothetical protein CEUSTIGMA_g2961.t1 [Chlamydomonas eustigma]|eukprot:GAX75518.1 hypothetical protein CEUSTIGMA_g2961.t1 [Chlamydomonas eustigma]
MNDDVLCSNTATVMLHSMLRKLAFYLTCSLVDILNSKKGRAHFSKNCELALFASLQSATSFVSQEQQFPMKSVNSGILADTGGTCNPAVNCNAERFAAVGEDCKFDGYGTNPEWAACISEVKQNLIAATCIAACISTIAMALVARMPLAVAPAMGVNAYFAYTVVGFMGSGRVAYEQALAAAFVEGWIFFVLSATGLRARLIELIPQNIMYATAAGIGCFLAFVGLQESHGLALITADGSTLVTLGGCPPDEQAHAYFMRDTDAYWHDWCWRAWREGIQSTNLTAGTDATAYAYFVNTMGLNPPINPSYECSTNIFASGTTTPFPDVRLGLPNRSPNYSCMGKQLQSPTMWLGIFGGALMVIWMVRGLQASILVGILFITFISWIPNQGATYFQGSPIPGGQDRYNYFVKGATVPSVAMTGGKLEFSALSNGDVWVALITFLYLDFLDATSTMFTMARMINDKVPGFLNEKGQWPRQFWTMTVDGLAIVVGSTLGTSPLTVLAESSVGVREGGRTGISALVIGLGFGISMFLSPIFASIPPYATGPAIVFVGALMMEHCRHVQWEDVRQAVPAFLTILLMPLTYSIAYGVLAGLLSAIFLWIVCFFMDAVTVLVGRGQGKTMRHVWLDNTCSVYLAINMEHVLIDELPDYVPRSAAHAGSQQHCELDDSEKFQDSARSSPSALIKANAEKSISLVAA